MRTSTILGISISLATGIVCGWSICTIKGEDQPKIDHDSIIAYSPPARTYTPPVNYSTPQSNPDIERAERLLNSSQPFEALKVLSDVSPNIDLASENGRAWLQLLVEGYAATDNKEQLMVIYQRFPSALASNEYAALAVAETLMQLQKTTDYDYLRNNWLGKESEKARWMSLDVQQKIYDDKPAEAIAILQNNHFSGKDETDRLVRLAALYVINEPKKAWGYLTEAARHDPSNSDIHTFRASLAEMLNKSQSANTDYIAAVQNDPESAFRREQLADFYLRTNQYPQALKILQDTMSEPSLDTIWVKTLFWSRVTIPIQNTWKGLEIPAGQLKEFVVYLNALPESVFWNEYAFNQLSDSQLFLTTLQETFWLQLLSELRNGREDNAQTLLNHNLFSHVSWSPELEKGLKTLLVFRQSQKNGAETLSLFPRASSIDSPKELLRLLAGLAGAPPEQVASTIPADLHDYLLGKEAFMAPFLAAGWTEAAIQLHAVKDFPNSFPGWIAAAFTEALNQNRSTKVALEFAASQKPSPALSLLVAEIALANNDKQTAFNALKGVYTTDDAHGRKAALLLGQFLMAHNNPQDAKKAILAQPSLENDLAAKEILARVAVQEADLEKAFAIYTTIEKQSSEAKSFLARKAYADKNWARARQLTEALLIDFPENTTLSENLKKIIAEEKKQKSPGK